MVLLGRRVQTARIRHGDKGSLCRRMSNALTDESETPSLSLSLSVFSRLIFALSLFTPLSLSICPPRALVRPLPLTPISIFQAVGPSSPSALLSLVITLLLFLVVRCYSALPPSHSRSLPPSSLFPSHFPHLLSLSVSISVCTSLSKFDFFFFFCLPGHTEQSLKGQFT